MKFLSEDESRRWLAPIGGNIDRNRMLSFTGVTKSLFVEPPSELGKLVAFLERAVDWLPRNGERFLWLSDWTTYPPHAFEFFEQIRSGFGERRHIIETPGCLFAPDPGSVDQEFSKVPDTSTLVGLSLLIVSFDWQGYLVVPNQASRVFLGDGEIAFASGDPCKLEDARRIFSQFKLKARIRA